MIYGYARVSTKGQAKDGNSLEAQEAELKKAGAEKIYTDAYTGTQTHRPELDKLIGVLQDGDTIVVTKLDRIARSLRQGIDLIDSLVEKGVAVNVMNMGKIDNTQRSLENVNGSDIMMYYALERGSTPRFATNSFNF